jgi:hypothetical protein
MMNSGRKIGLKLAGFKYAEAKVDILGFKPGSGKYQAYRQALLDRLETLTSFKAQLVRDLASGTYTGQVKKVPNALIPPGKITATDAGLDVKNPFGIMQVSWPEVAPETVIAMAKSFIKPELPADAAADRNWGLGIYALSVGQKAIAKELLTAASEAKPQFKEQLAKITEIDGL